MVTGRRPWRGIVRMVEQVLYGRVLVVAARSDCDPNALDLEAHRQECALHRCREGFVEASTLSSSSAATVALSLSPSPSAATVALSPSAVIVAPSSSSPNAATWHLHRGHIHRLVETNFGLNLVVEIDHVLGWAQLGRWVLLGGSIGWPPLLGGRSFTVHTELDHS